MKPEAGNPFGNWTKYRAQIASMARPDARSDGEAEARQLLKAARLADAILRERDSLTAEQRKTLAGLLA